MPKSFVSALSSIQPHKASGSDGFVNHHYKTFKPILCRRFDNELWNQGMCLEKHTSQSSQSWIRTCSYVLITGIFSLLNTNLKIFTKILYNCLLPYLPKLIDPDQVGFTPTRKPITVPSKSLISLVPPLEKYPCCYSTLMLKRCLIWWAKSLWVVSLKKLSWAWTCILDQRYIVYHLSNFSILRKWSPVGLLPEMAPVRAAHYPLDKGWI